MFQRLSGRNFDSRVLSQEQIDEMECKKIKACAVRKTGRGGYSVTTHRKGKAVTARFKSKAAAEKQVRAIQYFKRRG
jgi:hypothetical protein